MTAAARATPLLHIVSWQPLAWTATAGVVFVAVGSASGAALRLSIAGAAVAAATAFLVDDSAAVTLAGSPTPLWARRVARVAIAALVVPAWWATAATVAALRSSGVGSTRVGFAVAVLVTVALAVSAAAGSTGDGAGGGIAGAACAAACFGSTFLPPQWWMPFPHEPTTPGAMGRWVALLGCAVALLAWTSRDPARRGPDVVPLSRDPAGRRRRRR